MLPSLDSVRGALDRAQSQRQRPEDIPEMPGGPPDEGGQLLPPPPAPGRDYSWIRPGMRPEGPSYPEQGRPDRGDRSPYPQDVSPSLAQARREATQQLTGMISTVQRAEAPPAERDFLPTQQTPKWLEREKLLRGSTARFDVKPEEEATGAGYLREHIRAKQKKLAESVETSGMAEYPTIKGFGDVIETIRQVPGLGTGLTVGVGGFLNVMSVPSEAAEIGLANAIYGQDRANFGVRQGNQGDERLYQASNLVLYSGPKARKRMFQEAQAMQDKQGSPLSMEQIEELKGKHGVWWKQMIGEAVFDPLNIIDAAPKLVGKGVQVGSKQLRRASEAFDILGKVDLRPTDEILGGLGKATTVAGQIKAEPGLIKKVLNVVNPRLSGSIKNRLAENAGQLTQTTVGNISKRVEADLIARGLDPKTPEFVEQFSTALGENVNRITRLWADLASDNLDEVEAASRALIAEGFGPVHSSTTGRQTAVVLRRLMTNDKGEIGDLVNMMEAAKSGGFSAEHVAELWTKKAVDIFDSLVPEQSWEKIPGFFQKVQRETVLGQANQLFATLYMGLNPGYAMRNIMSDHAMLVAQNWSPFIGPELARSLADELGYTLKAAARDMGGVMGAGDEPLSLLNFGQWMANKFEKYSSAKIVGQAQRDMLQRGWRSYINKLELPPGTPPELARIIKGQLEGMGTLGIDKVDNLERLVLEQINSATTGGRAAGVTAGAPTPPSGAPSVSPVGGVLSETWRTPSQDLLRAAADLGDGVADEIVELGRNAANLDEYIDGLRGLQRKYMEHADRVIDLSQGSGHVGGSVSSEAVAGAVRSDKFDPETIDDLAHAIGSIEDEIRVSRARAFAAARTSIEPDQWTAYLDEIEGVYQEALQALRQTQLTDYARLMADEITVDQYVKKMFDQYGAAKRAVDREYSKVIGESSGLKRPIDLSQPMNPKAHLHSELNKAAVDAGVPSLVFKRKGQKGIDALERGAFYTEYGPNPDLVPNPHFDNLVKKLTGKKLKDLDSEDLVKVINELRSRVGKGELKASSFDPVARQQVYDQAKEWAEHLPPEFQIGAVPGAQAAPDLGLDFLAKEDVIPTWWKEAPEATMLVDEFGDNVIVGTGRLNGDQLANQFAQNEQQFENLRASAIFRKEGDALVTDDPITSPTKMKFILRKRGIADDQKIVYAFGTPNEKTTTLAELGAKGATPEIKVDMEEVSDVAEGLLTPDLLARAKAERAKMKAIKEVMFDNPEDLALAQRAYGMIDEYGERTWSNFADIMDHPFDDFGGSVSFRKVGDKVEATVGPKHIEGSSGMFRGQKLGDDINNFSLMPERADLNPSEAATFAKQMIDSGVPDTTPVFVPRRPGVGNFDKYTLAEIAEGNVKSYAMVPREEFADLSVQLHERIGQIEDMDLLGDEINDLVDNAVGEAMSLSYQAGAQPSDDQLALLGDAIRRLDDFIAKQAADAPSVADQIKRVAAMDSPFPSYSASEMRDALRSVKVPQQKEALQNILRGADEMPKGSNAWTISDDGYVMYFWREGGDNTGVPYSAYRQWLDGRMDALKQVNNIDVQQAVQADAALRGAGGTPIPPDPSAATAVRVGGEDALRVIDNLIQEARSFAEIPPQAVPFEQLIPEQWSQFFADVRSNHFLNQNIAGDVARRARDTALLDYSDRRFFDPMIQMVFPWGYWSTRALPNWAGAILTNPRMVNQYARAKRYLREHNEQDPTLPEWARDQLVVESGLFKGKLMIDLEASLNPIGALFDTFDDEDAQQNAFGRFVSNLGNYGPAPSPLLMLAYAASRGIAGDDAGARSAGYIAPLSRTFATITGKPLEPWLWTRDPQTGRRIPLSGGTKWEVGKAGRLLGWKEGQGQISHEEAMFANTTRTSAPFLSALGDVFKARRLPVLASNILGLRLQVRQPWEGDLTQQAAEYRALKNQMGKTMAAEQFLAKYPEMTTVWMSYDNERERMASLAWDVFDRVPPGESKTKFLANAGMSEAMQDAFYDSKGNLTGWTQEDVRDFGDALLDLASVLGGPTATQAREWAKARQLKETVGTDLVRKYPDYYENNNTYWQLRETQGKAAANAYAAQSGLFDAWDYQRTQIIDNPLLLKYYADEQDVTSAAKSIRAQLAEEQWPGIYRKQDTYYSLPKEERKAFLRQNRDLKEYWDWNDPALEAITKELETARQEAQADLEGPNIKLPENASLGQRQVYEQMTHPELAPATQEDVATLEGGMQAVQEQQKSTYTPYTPYKKDYINLGYIKKKLDKKRR